MRCEHLTPALLCGIYEARPQICRDYAADALCVAIAAPTLEGRVGHFLSIFGLEEEGAANALRGTRSMKVARGLPLLVVR